MLYKLENSVKPIILNSKWNCDGAMVCSFQIKEIRCYLKISNPAGVILF